jgi:undecaprenyl-diphosphatase
MEHLDHALFLALNASSTPPWQAVFLALLAAKYVIGLVPLHIGLVWAGGTRRMRVIALTAVVAIALALVQSLLLGVVAYTPRPFLLGIGHTLMEHRPSSSFPSNHATVFFTYAMVLALFGAERLAAVVASIGCVVAWSRIYLGVHFPLDMAGAAAISAVGGYVATRLARHHGDAAVSRLEILARREAPWCSMRWNKLCGRRLIVGPVPIEPAERQTSPTPA